MRTLPRSIYIVLVLAMFLASCAPATTAPAAQPTTAPAVEQPTTAPAAAQPTTAPAAVQPTTAPAGPAVEVSFWHSMGSKGLGDAITELVKRFNDSHPNIHVTATYQGTYGDSRQKLMANVAAGTPPTLVQAPPDTAAMLIAAKAALPLDDFEKANPIPLSDLYPAYSNVARVEGKLYGVPFNRSTPIIYINRDHFKAAGLDPDKPGTTWEELTKTALALTKRDASGKTTQWGMILPMDDWYLEAMVYQQGITLLNNNNGHDGVATKGMMDTPEAIEALTWWQDLVYKDKVSTTLTNDQALAEFLAGNVSMLWNSVGGLTNISSQAKFDLGATTLPSHKTKGVPLGGAALFLLNKTTPEQQKAGWEFMKWLTEDPQTIYWSLQTGYLPVRPSAVNSPEMQKHFADMPISKVALDQMDAAAPEPFTPALGSCWDAIDLAMEQALTKQMDVKTALTTAEASMEKAIKTWQDQNK